MCDLHPIPDLVLYLLPLWARHLSATISAAFCPSCSQKWLQLEFEWNFLLSLVSVFLLATGSGQEVGFCRIFWMCCGRLKKKVRFKWYPLLPLQMCQCLFHCAAVYRVLFFLNTMGSRFTIRAQTVLPYADNSRNAQNNLQDISYMINFTRLHWIGRIVSTSREVKTSN